MNIEQWAANPALIGCRWSWETVKHDGMEIPDIPVLIVDDDPLFAEEIGRDRLNAIHNAASSIRVVCQRMRIDVFKNRSLSKTDRALINMKRVLGMRVAVGTPTTPESLSDDVLVAEMKRRGLI